MEERKEEYDRARAHMFKSSDSSTSDDTVTPPIRAYYSAVNHLPDTLSQVSAEIKNFSTSKDDIKGSENSVTDVGKSLASRDVGSSSRVAILRDRDKDCTDPHHDRSYIRYIKSFPSGQRLLTPFNMQNFQPPLMQFNAGCPQIDGQMPRAKSSLNYGPSSDILINQFSSVGINLASRDANYMQWPSLAMMCAHSYEPFRHALFQPLSFDYSKND